MEKEDDQSILIETSSCNLQFFSELLKREFSTQKKHFTMVLPQTVVTYFKSSVYCNKNNMFVQRSSTKTKVPKINRLWDLVITVPQRPDVKENDFINQDSKQQQVGKAFSPPPPTSNLGSATTQLIDFTLFKTTRIRIYTL